jgi:hypothetical protein
MSFLRAIIAALRSARVVPLREQMARDHQNDADDLDDSRTKPHVDNGGFQLPILASPREGDEHRVRKQKLDAQEPENPPRILRLSSYSCSANRPLSSISCA